MRQETILTIAVDISKEMKNLWENKHDSFEKLINLYSPPYDGNYVFNTKTYILNSPQFNSNYYLGIVIQSSFSESKEEDEKHLELLEQKNFYEYCQSIKNIVNDTANALFNCEKEAKLMMLNLYY